MTENKLRGATPIEGEGLRGDGTPRWYVVHTYSGHENKVKINIERQVETRNMRNLILDIQVPTENVSKKNDKGEIATKVQKIYPGYIIIKMIITNESWYLVRNTQGVTGFVGNGSDPMPLSPEEVRRMGIEKVEAGFVKEGDTVKILKQPFEGHVGEVKGVDETTMTVKVAISMAGRETVLDGLTFDDIAYR